MLFGHPDAARKRTVAEGGRSTVLVRGCQSMSTLWCAVVISRILQLTCSSALADPVDGQPRLFVRR